MDSRVVLPVIECFFGGFQYVFCVPDVRFNLSEVRLCFLQYAAETLVLSLGHLSTSRLRARTARER